MTTWVCDLEMGLTPLIHTKYHAEFQVTDGIVDGLAHRQVRGLAWPLRELLWAHDVVVRRERRRG